MPIISIKSLLIGIANTVYLICWRWLALYFLSAN